MRLRKARKVTTLTAMRVVRLTPDPRAPTTMSDTQPDEAIRRSSPRWALAFMLSTLQLVRGVTPKFGVACGRRSLSLLGVHIPQAHTSTSLKPSLWCHSFFMSLYRYPNQRNPLLTMLHRGSMQLQMTHLCLCNTPAFTSRQAATGTAHCTHKSVVI